MPIRADKHLIPMIGGAKSHLMLCNDFQPYVVKFQNNPQHLRVLANELLASRLAQAVGLSIPSCTVVEVAAELVSSTQKCDYPVPQDSAATASHNHFGSLFVGGLTPGQRVDYLPDKLLLKVTNLGEFAGMLAFDKWTCNRDRRQVAFAPANTAGKYKAWFIDQGYCFGANWQFDDRPWEGAYKRNSVYQDVRGWGSFEPWLHRIETIDPTYVRYLAQTIPPEWYEYDYTGLDELVDLLLARREKIRKQIELFRNSRRDPFPNWSPTRF